MAHRHIAFGNGQKAGQPGLRGQQVIEPAIQLLLRNPKANVKKMPAAAVEKVQIARPGQLLKRPGQRTKAFIRLGHGRGDTLGCRWVHLRGSHGVPVIGQQPLELQPLWCGQLGASHQQGFEPFFCCLNSPLRDTDVEGRLGQFEAGLSDGQQIAAEIAAVYRGDVQRQQRLTALSVVPIQEMTPIALQPEERLECRLQTAQQVIRSNPAKLASAGHA